MASDLAIRQWIGQSIHDWAEGASSIGPPRALLSSPSPAPHSSSSSSGLTAGSLHLVLPFASPSTRIAARLIPALLGQFPAVLPVGTRLQHDPCLTSASFLVRPAPRTHFSRRSFCPACFCFANMPFCTNLTSRALSASSGNGTRRPIAIPISLSGGGLLRTGSFVF